MSYISVCWDIFIVHISKYFIFQNISYFRIFPISEYFLFLISYDYDYLLSPISILYLILSHIYILDNILSKRSRDTARRTGADCHGLIVMDNTLLHCTIDYSFVQFITVLHYNYAILYCIILYIILYYTILYYILHYFTVVHYKMMYCIV